MEEKKCVIFPSYLKDQFTFMPNVLFVVHGTFIMLPVFLFLCYTLIIQKRENNTGMHFFVHKHSFAYERMYTTYNISLQWLSNKTQFKQTIVIISSLTINSYITVLKQFSNIYIIKIYEIQLD